MLLPLPLKSILELARFSITFFLWFAVYCNRFTKGISSEFQMKHDSFLEECILDPTLRDEMAILSRTFQNKQKVLAYVSKKQPGGWI